MDQDGFGVARISLVFVIPGRDDPKHFVAEALSHALAGRETSRLDQALREESGLSYAVTSSITATPNWGLLRFDTEVLPENIGETLKNMDAMFQTLTNEGISEDEFESIRRGLVLDRARRFELTKGAMLGLGELQRSRQAPDTFSAQATAFELLTTAELSEQAANLFLPGSACWFVTGDSETIRPQLEAIEWILATDTDAASLSRSP